MFEEKFKMFKSACKQAKLKKIAIYGIRQCIKKFEEVLDTMEESSCDGMLQISDECVEKIREIEILIRRASLENRHGVSFVIDNQKLMSALTTHFAHCGFVVNPNDASHVFTISWMA